MMTKHTKPATPLPWKVIGKEDLMIKGHVCGTGGDEEGNKYFVQGVDYPEGFESASEDAAYIVKAANTAPVLAEALRAVEWSGYREDTPACPSCDCDEADGHVHDCQLAAALDRWETTDD
jgi:hypothetical protein